MTKNNNLPILDLSPAKETSNTKFVGLKAFTAPNVLEEKQNKVEIEEKRKALKKQNLKIKYQVKIKEDIIKKLVTYCKDNSITQGDYLEFLINNDLK
jgi:Replication regulatory protein RepB